MRPLKINGEEIGGGNLMGKNSLVPAVQELWNTWEIHCLILCSLFLQVSLFLFAGIRRRSSSWVLSTVLWLAYLSADSVAILVLGHLAVRHESGPRQQLMSFWAPFVLVHLGGQDTITALSRQDNELWRRHLLSLVTQVAVAGYVVAKVPWPDTRLRAAMVIMFLTGCLKYAERTFCLYIASPAQLRSEALSRLPEAIEGLEHDKDLPPAEHMKKKLDTMWKGSTSGNVVIRSIMSVDAPLNTAESIFSANELPAMLEKFLSTLGRYQAYDHVGASLVRCYKRLYTKSPIRKLSWRLLIYIFARCRLPDFRYPTSSKTSLLIGLFLLHHLFLSISTPVALVLFWSWSSEKKGQGLLPHTNRADIIVSYVLLVGAIALDVLSAVMSIFYFVTTNLFRDGGIIINAKLFLSLASCIQRPAQSTKQWSENLAQYNMIKRHVVVEGSGCMTSLLQWMARARYLGDWGVGLLEITHTPVTEDRTSIKEFILDKLLGFGTGKEWNIATSRGQLAVRKWMQETQQAADVVERTGKALEKIITSNVDFPTSVLVWHIATNICYYFRGNDDDDHDDYDDYDDYDEKNKHKQMKKDEKNKHKQMKKDEKNKHKQMKKHKQVSKELSNYVTYLVFKCGVMLTTNSQLVHDNAHNDITRVLSANQDHQHGQKVTALVDEKEGVTSWRKNEKDVVTKLFLESKRGEKKEEEHHHQQDQWTIDIHKHEESANDDNAANSHLQKLVQSAQALGSPVLPRACELVQELITINDETERWHLIASVWSEMLFYTAPRCGGPFHYEHLATGGEFITHVLLLMTLLGPFLPPPDAYRSP